MNKLSGWASQIHHKVCHKFRSRFNLKSGQGNLTSLQSRAKTRARSGSKNQPRWALRFRSFIEKSKQVEMKIESWFCWMNFERRLRWRKREERLRIRKRDEKLEEKLEKNQLLLHLNDSRSHDRCSRRLTIALKTQDSGKLHSKTLEASRNISSFNIPARIHHQILDSNLLS